MRSAKKVDMILVHFHHLHLNLGSLFYAGNPFPDYLDSLFAEKGFSILYREDDVIMNLPRPERSLEKEGALLL